MRYLVNGRCTIFCDKGSQPGQLISPSQLARGRGLDGLNNIRDVPSQVTNSYFGTCGAPANPENIAQMAASQGSFAVSGCIPRVVGTWVPGSVGKVIDGAPALTHDSTCICAYGGTIRVMIPGTWETG